MDNTFHTAVPIVSYEVVRSMGANGQEELWLALDGVASDASTDKLKGIVHPEAIERMVRIINQQSPLFRNEQSAKNAEPVGLDVEHSNNWRDQIGYVARAFAEYHLSSEEILAGAVAPLLKVRVMVDLGMSAGQDLKRALDKGAKLGLSIYGQVIKGYKKIERATGQTLEHFVDIGLQKIAVTSQPVNANTWLTIARSMVGVEEEMSYEGEAMLKEDTEQNENADVLAWARENAALIRSMMSAKTEETETVEDRASDEVARAETEEVRAEETVTDSSEVARSGEADEPAKAEVKTPEYISRADHDAELGELKELLRSLPEALSTLATGLQAEVTALKEEIRLIGDEPAGRRGSIVRSMEEALGAETKQSDELAPGWDKLSVNERTTRLAELKKTNPDAANYLVLRKLFHQVKPEEQELTAEAQALAG